MLCSEMLGEMDYLLQNVGIISYRKVKNELKIQKKLKTHYVFSFCSLDGISEGCKLMKFLEELSQFSCVKGLACEVPVNGPWDEQIPLVPITVVCNDTLYFILASVLSTPVELFLPRSLVSSSGPNLKAIILFICSLTFWLHLTDLIIISVLKFWLKKMEPVSPVHFLFAPTVTFLGHHFFLILFFSSSSSVL